MKHIASQRETVNNMKRKSVGRQEDKDREEAFLKMLKCFEEDDSYVTIESFKNLMAECDVEPYSTKFLKRKLELNFNDDIFFTKINQTTAGITLRSTTKEIIKSFNKKRNENSQKRNVKTTFSMQLPKF